MKLGSLFDGSGGFPLAGTMCGIEPVWAAEVEPYPIAVTRSRFLNMKHLGDIRKVSGADIEPVDIVTFGSPCQGLSQAGLRLGLEDDRSGLFREAIRIIKEMREATNGVYPTVILWENVPGAFSSNKGEDFKVVLEEIVKIKEPTAVMPEVPQGGWAFADCYWGDGWSLAYRVFDAQYWGVPQRRRRIYLVADFTGQCAKEILFERQGLRGYFETGRMPWQATPADSEDGVGADDRAGAVGVDVYNQASTGNKSMTLTARNTDSHHIPCVAYSFDSLASNSMNSSNPNSGCRAVHVSKTLDTTDQNPSKNQGGIAVVEAVYCLQGSMIGRADKNGPQGDGVNEDVSFTCTAIDRHAVAYLASGKETVGTLMANAGTKLWLGNQEAFSGDYAIVEETPPARYIVRRLTPTECARLQGFADWWGRIEKKKALTDDEYRFWLDVRNTHAAINGKAVKEYNEKQMLTWYNKLWTDAAEYKMWGNGISLPTALYCMQGIADVLERRMSDGQQQTKGRTIRAGACL